MSEPWTILKVLDWTRTHFESKRTDAPRLDAELILAHVLNLPRVMLYAKFDQPLDKEELAKIRALVARRARGEPMAYLLGTREFYGLDLEVTPAVLIPRPDTEVLVEVAIQALKNTPTPKVADVGTGSGAIAIAIAKNLPTATLTAIDLSQAALEVARRNAAKHNLSDRITFHEGDLLTPTTETFHLIAANLPYIPTQVIPTLDRDVKDFEPKTALDGGPDGLALIRRLLEHAKDRLVPNGTIALEIGYDQGKAAQNLATEAGFNNPRIHKDLGHQDRVLEATNP